MEQISIFVRYMHINLNFCAGIFLCNFRVEYFLKSGWESRVIRRNINFETSNITIKRNQRLHFCATEFVCKLQ